MEHDLLDAALHLGLAARVHHFGDGRDGGGEGVELFLQSSNRQNRNARPRMNLLGSGQGSLGVLQHRL